MTTHPVHGAPPARDWPSRSRGDRDRERMLFRRYAATGDAAVKELLVKEHLGLARSVASRFERSSVPHDDRMQLACVGLLKAIDRYDPDRGAAFSSYAVPLMVGEIQHYVRDQTWAVRPPRELQERMHRLDRTAATLGAELGRSATSAELARATGFSVEEVLDTLEAARAHDCASLDEPVGADGDTALAATIGAEDVRYRQAENRVLADELLSRLTPREERILRLRFEHELTQTEIGRMVGRSQMQVSRILHAALEQLSASAAQERADVLTAV
jgi:RNA polymerase sigma-B factor